MRFRTFKNTDLKVSEVGFGLWTISTGWWGNFTEGEAIALMHKAFDLGITLFDARTGQLAAVMANAHAEAAIAYAAELRAMPAKAAVAFLTDITGVDQLWQIPTTGGWPVRLSFTQETVHAADYSPVRHEIASESGSAATRIAGHAIDIRTNAIPATAGHAGNLRGNIVHLPQSRPNTCCND